MFCDVTFSRNQTLVGNFCADPESEKQNDLSRRVCFRNELYNPETRSGSKFVGRCIVLLHLHPMNIYEVAWWHFLIVDVTVLVVAANYLLNLVRHPRVKVLPSLTEKPSGLPEHSSLGWTNVRVRLAGSLERVSAISALSLRAAQDLVEVELWIRNSQGRKFH